MNQLNNTWIWLAILAVTVALLGLWLLPRCQTPSAVWQDPKERLRDRNELRKTLAQIMGGAVVLFGLFFTWHQSQLQRAKQSLEQLAKALDLLSSENPALRVAAISVLRQSAQSGSAQDRGTVVEVLSAFLREKRPALAVPGGPAATDVQAALSALGALLGSSPRLTVRADLRGVDLRNMRLAGLKLANSDLTSSLFNGSVLDHAQLDGASLRGAQLGLVEGSLPPDDECLTNIRAGWCFLFEGLTRGTRLADATLRDADLSFSDLTGANLWHADLAGATLSSAQLAFARLSEADLSRARLDGACLDTTFFMKTNLREADVSGADLRTTRADVFQMMFGGLRSALESTRFSEADFTNATLSGAILHGVDLSEAKGLTQQQLEQAELDEITKLPANLRLPRRREEKQRPLSESMLLDTHCVPVHDH